MKQKNKRNDYLHKEKSNCKGMGSNHVRTYKNVNRDNEVWVQTLSEHNKMLIEINPLVENFCSLMIISIKFANIVVKKGFKVS